MKEDIDELRRQTAENEARIAALEKWQEQANSNITALQALVEALNENDYITEVTEFDTPEPGGYTISFLKGSPITIYHGSNGHSPVIEIQEYTDGRYYWTLDGHWLTDTDGKMIPAEGYTPKVAIGSDGYWYISETGDATGTPPGPGWTSTDVYATGDDGDSMFDGIDIYEDYVVFNLNDGASLITIPLYKTVGISFEQPGLFSASQIKIIKFTSTGSAEATNIRVVDIPADWKISLNMNENTITATAPSTITSDNYYGEATILVGEGEKVAAMYGLILRADGFFKVGDYYPDPLVNLDDPAEKAAVQGVVFWVDTSQKSYNSATGGGAYGKIVSLDEGTDLVWGPDDVVTGALDENNGLMNMATVQSVDSDFSSYPAYAWADAKNPGGTTYNRVDPGVWYLPSKYELLELRCAWNGGTAHAEVNNGRSIFDGILTAAGGDNFTTDPKWSSTESKDVPVERAWGIMPSGYFSIEDYKDSAFNCRAVMVFGSPDIN
ncbi:MAG: DUF4988 domain-containing protein [Rikenellaceae bacterium]|nr:DUF4988 domain-containing protein [Rikenellaceae bacterium]